MIGSLKFPYELLSNEPSIKLIILRKQIGKVWRYDYDSDYMQLNDRTEVLLYIELILIHSC